jgi:hypothetical protein
MFDQPQRLRVLPKAGVVLRGPHEYRAGMVMPDVDPVTAQRLVKDQLAEVA